MLKVASMVVMMCATGSSAWAFSAGDTTDTAGSTATADTTDTASTPIVDSTPTGPTGITGLETADETALDTGTGKGTTDTDDSGDGFTTYVEDTYTCPDCLGAADLAGDPGGSPCGDCTTGSAPPWLAVMALLGLARRRRAPHA